MCDSPPETYMMCPLCDESLGCHPVDLHGSCMLGKVCTLTLVPVQRQEKTFSKSLTAVGLACEQALVFGPKVQAVWPQGRDSASDCPHM